METHRAAGEDRRGPVPGPRQGRGGPRRRARRPHRRQGPARTGPRRARRVGREQPADSRRGRAARVRRAPAQLRDAWSPRERLRHGPHPEPGHLRQRRQPHALPREHGQLAGRGVLQGDPARGHPSGTAGARVPPVLPGRALRGTRPGDRLGRRAAGQRRRDGCRRGSQREPHRGLGAHGPALPGSHHPGRCRPRPSAAQGDARHGAHRRDRGCPRRTATAPEADGPREAPWPRPSDPFPGCAPSSGSHVPRRRCASASSSARPWPRPSGSRSHRPVLGADDLGHRHVRLAAQRGGVDQEGARADLRHGGLGARLDRHLRPLRPAAAAHARQHCGALRWRSTA